MNNLKILWLLDIPIAETIRIKQITWRFSSFKFILFLENIAARRLYKIPESRWYNLYFFEMYFAILSFPDPEGPSIVIINLYR